MVASTDQTGSALLGLSNSLADAVENAGKSLVAVNARRHSPSTGIHWRSGVIVTADHTLERDEGITITLPDGSQTAATIAARDSGTDLAVLKAEGIDLPEAEIGDAGSLRVGHIVIAVARPGEGLSASWGTVSALSGAWRTWSGGQIDQLIRPDLTLYPGFSGGPLVDGQGRVVGINTSGLSRGLSLAIPASTVNRVVEQLLTRGRISRGYLGISLQPVRLPDNLKGSLGISDSGALIVVSLEEGGPAEKAGLLVGDIIVSLDGKSVTDPRDIQSVLGSESVGKSIAAKLVRGGAPTELSITVGERPARG